MGMLEALLLTILSLGQLEAADQESIVESGPRIQAFEVQPESEAEKIQTSLPIKVGDLWNPELLELIERYLESTQRYENVRVSWQTELHILKIEVQPREFFKQVVWTEHRPSNDDEIEAACLMGREAQDMSQSRITQINKCILRLLQREGYLDAKVLLLPDKSTLKIELLPGDRYRIQSLGFEGNEKLGATYLRRKLSMREGAAFNPYELEDNTNALRAAYLRRGYYLVDVFQPSLQIRPSDQSVEISWKITEGEKVGIEFSGYYLAEGYLRDLVERGESLPEWYLDEVIDQIRQDLVDEGYLEVQIDRKEKLINENYRRIWIHIQKGVQYRLAEPQFVGVDDVETIRKIYSEVSGLRVGKRFNEELYRESFREDFFQELLNKGFVEASLKTLEFSINRPRGLVQPLIYMNEGPQFILGKTNIVGMPAEFTDLSSYEEIESAMGAGKIFNPLEMDELQKSLEQDLISEGYLDVKVSRTSEKFVKGSFSFVLQVEPGPRYRVAEVLIRGLDKTKPSVVRREILIEEGEYYSRQAINDTISQILRLGIARSVDIRVFEKLEEEEIVYLVVDVLEASRYRIEFGPGYGTVDGLRAILRATYANIGGTGRRLSLNTKASRKLEKAERPTDVLNDDSEPIPFIERRVILEYFEPSLFDSPLDARVTLSHRKQSVDNFDLMSNAFATALDYRITRHWSYTPEYRIEYSNPFNVPIASETLAVDDTSPKRLHSLGQSIYAVYVDDNFSPTKGLRNRVSFELFDKRLGGNLNFWLFTTKHEFFVPVLEWFTERDVNIALSLNSGFSRAYSDTADIPVEKRYRVGGEGTVRGYVDAGIQPLDRSGEPLRNGGRSMFFFRSELAVPVVGSLDLLGFLDGGNIYVSNKAWNPIDLRYGAGGGLRFNTPVGPLKAGYAFVLDRRPGESIGQIYFGVGPL